MESLADIFIRALFLDNLALVFFLGMCTFLAISRQIRTALGLGAAVILVEGVTVPLNNLIYSNFLREGALAWAGMPHLDFSYLGLISYIGVIAAVVQILEIVLRRYFRGLYHSLASSCLC